MKKNLLILISLVFALVLCVTVFAASGDAAVGSDTAVGSGSAADNNSLTISVDIPTSYEFKIPADVALEFGAEYTEIGTVTASNVRPPADTELCISYNDSSSLKTEDGMSEIPYEIQIDYETAGDLFFMEDGESAALYVAIDKAAWDAAPAGSYSDTITFTASLSELAQ